jgi:hypothetical protein
MNNLIGYAILIAITLVIIVLSACQPQLLSNKNSFLDGFVNHEFLNILGVIVAITAASASNVHLELRRLESEYNFPNGFENTRREVKRGAFALLWLFLAAFVLVVVKPILSTNENIESLLNGAAVVIIAWNILVLLALLQLAFKVGPISIDDHE